jgi:hypothetical protein
MLKIDIKRESPPETTSYDYTPRNGVGMRLEVTTPAGETR